MVAHKLYYSKEEYFMYIYQCYSPSGGPACRQQRPYSVYFFLSNQSCRSDLSKPLSERRDLFCEIVLCMSPSGSRAIPSYKCCRTYFLSSLSGRRDIFCVYLCVVVYVCHYCMLERGASSSV